MTRKWLALLSIALVAGCGGDSEPEESPAPKRAEPTGDEQVRLEVEQRGDRLAATMARLANTLRLADCDQAPVIVRLRDRMLARSRELTAYRVEPALEEDIAGVQGTVGELDAEIDGLLQDCRDERELERAADEADRLADEIEAEANEP